MSPPGSGPQALWTELGELACQLAVEAGALVVDLAGPARAGATTKSSPTDMVTLADRASEEQITNAIVAARPHDAIAGEEGADRDGTTGVVWHIDPIDGTTNYLYAIPAFSVSIGVAQDGVMVAGAVYNPVRSELYRAVRHGGAWCNDEPLRCSSKADLPTALAATGFSYDPARRRHQAEVLVEVLPRLRDIRRFGSAALDLCAMASGQVDLYWEQGLNPWDLAAGALVASESGAIVGNLRGGPPDPSFVLAAPSSLFDQARSLLIQVGADREL